MKKVKLDLSFEILGLEGEVTDHKPNKIVASVLGGSASETKQEAATAMKIALDMIKNPEVELLISEFRTVQKLVEKSGLINMIKNPIMDYFDSIKT
jgi:hypothetical protein